MLVNTVPQTGSIIPSTGVLRIGGDAVWGDYFQGYIDEVRIYNKALSNAQIINDSITAVSSSNPLKLIIGDPNVETTMASISAGVAQAFRFTVAANMSRNMTNLLAYLDASSTAKGLVVGLYTDNNGHPGALWSYAKLTALQAGAWNSLSVAPLGLNNGKSYWIALLGTGGTLQLRGQPDTSAVLAETSASSALTGLPTTWATGGVASGGPVSVYAAGY